MPIVRFTLAHQNTERGRPMSQLSRTPPSPCFHLTEPKWPQRDSRRHIFNWTKHIICGPTPKTCLSQFGQQSANFLEQPRLSCFTAVVLPTLASDNIDLDSEESFACCCLWIKLLFKALGRSLFPVSWQSLQRQHSAV